ncbi:type II toxin-antitoxin system VapB family antitoxin [Methyloglobulus sp.]|uniref:type II toxin-antitoxin system VapB family antitoxin n=1 Tax=Methyloglobulus sp. TaxID=2518622 RepID=UPI0032B7F6BE
MRTNVVIDNTLMQEALKATGLKVKKEAVELGLKTLIILRKQTTLKELKGKLHWEGSLDELRADQ